MASNNNRRATQEREWGQLGDYKGKQRQFHSILDVIVYNVATSKDNRFSQYH